MMTFTSGTRSATSMIFRTFRPKSTAVSSTSVRPPAAANVCSSSADFSTESSAKSGSISCSQAGGST
jgi:hypothetical protein